MTDTFSGTADTAARKTRQAMFRMWSSCLKCHKAFDPFAASGASDSMHVDHVVPSSKGGPDHLSNYQPLCSPCNTSKGNRSSADYRSAEQKALYPVPAEIPRRREELERINEEIERIDWVAGAREQAKRKAEKAAREDAEQRAAAAGFYNSPAEVAKHAARSAQQDERDRQVVQRARRSVMIRFVVLLGLIAAIVWMMNMHPPEGPTTGQDGAGLTGVPVSVFSAF